MLDKLMADFDKILEIVNKTPARCRKRRSR